MRLLLPLALFVLVANPRLPAGELARLTSENWQAQVPRGKEVDAILGDLVLRNDHVVAVIARPTAGRHANMTVRNVGGAVIDLTTRTRPNDQLSAYYPEAARFRFAEMRAIADGKEVAVDEPLSVSGTSLQLQLVTRAAPGEPRVTLTYQLDDGQRALRVVSRIENPHDTPINVKLEDAIRADRTFQFGLDRELELVWAEDDWFHQAYGVKIARHDITVGGNRNAQLVLTFRGNSQVRLDPGEEHVITRHLIPGPNLVHVKAVAAEMAGVALEHFRVAVTDPGGPVADARVSLVRDGAPYARGRTDAEGRLALDVPRGSYAARVEALGRPPRQFQVEGGGGDLNIELEACGHVAAEITDERGGAIPCKVAFHGIDGTADPDFGPDSRAVSLVNLHYSHNGTFRQAIAPGKYRVIVSHGPEFDAIFREIEVERGRDTKVAGVLRRVVATPGWISADFHSHASPSGDNTASQRGRVLNLLCEHVEFAPCTEHNRVDSYARHLRALGQEAALATCSGMELTGSPLPINHQNAFPLVHRPRTQDGGGPETDENPVVQIERLALWDDGAEKLVQANHPDLVQMLADRDLNGEFDGGFSQMFAWMHVMEVHPPAGIFSTPSVDPAGRRDRNPMFHWMQMLNLGYRIPGVVNTDAHYNFHESGWLRNYLRSDDDQPATVDTMALVRSAKAGNVVMTTGPYLHVEANARGKRIGPGDSAAITSGGITLHITVQCANWLDINRVQIFRNGRPDPELNFTRRTHGDHFANGVVKFERAIDVPVSTDTHLIVAAAGEGLELGPVMGPTWGKQLPVAVTNPIFIDADGDGFKPNGDLLDFPLPKDAASGGN